MNANEMKLMEEVTFEWPGAAMDANGWSDGDVDMAADIDQIIEEARRNKRRWGKGWIYPFKCNRAQALHIERLTRVLGEAWSYEEDPEVKREARVLIAAANRIMNALDA